MLDSTQLLVCFPVRVSRFWLGSSRLSCDGGGDLELSASPRRGAARAPRPDAVADARPAHGAPRGDDRWGRGGCGGSGAWARCREAERRGFDCPGSTGKALRRFAINGCLTAGSNS